jgi:outer membrane immunogenic protein
MAALAFGGTANAADMPVKAAPAPLPALYDWSGIYVGFHSGYSWGSVHDVLGTPGAYTTDTNVKNGIVGFHVGIQREFTGILGFGGLVLGLEGGLNEPTKENDTSNFALCFNPAFACGIRNFRDNWYGGGRLGLAWNWAGGGWIFGGDYLLYASGGYTTARFVREDFNLATGARCVGLSCTNAWHNGGYVGVGLDHVWAKGVLVDWVSGIEYQHHFFGNQTDFDVTGVGHQLNADVDIIKLRTTLKFK